MEDMEGEGRVGQPPSKPLLGQCGSGQAGSGRVGLGRVRLGRAGPGALSGLVGSVRFGFGLAGSGRVGAGQVGFGFGWVGSTSNKNDDIERRRLRTPSIPRPNKRWQDER